MQRNVDYAYQTHPQVRTFLSPFTRKLARLPSSSPSPALPLVITPSSRAASLAATLLPPLLSLSLPAMRAPRWQRCISLGRILWIQHGSVLGGTVVDEAMSPSGSRRWFGSDGRTPPSGSRQQDPAAVRHPRASRDWIRWRPPSTMYSPASLGRIYWRPPSTTPPPCFTRPSPASP